MSTKQIDFIVISSILIGAAWFSWILDLKPLTFSIFYLLLPSIYLMIRKRKNYKKLFWGVLTLGLFLGIGFDLIETLNGAWTTIRIVFPWHILGVSPVDNILGYMLMTLFTLVFYEHFLDTEPAKQQSKGLTELLILSGGFMLFVVVSYLTHRSYITISEFAYFKGGILAIIFPLYYFFRNPKLIPKAATTLVFFLFVWLLAGLVMVRNVGWIYPGQYIGWFNLFGITLPIEELLFWMIFYATTIVAFYERFIDDGK